MQDKTEKNTELLEQTDHQDSDKKPLVIPEDDIPLVMDFITESSEHIESAESGLLELENDPKNEETLNLIFRSFHTIKGMAGFLSLNEIQSLAHASENLLDMARKGNLLLTGGYTDIVFESIDNLKNMLEDLRKSAEQNLPVQPFEKLDELTEKLKNAAEGKLDLEKPATDKDVELDKILENPEKPATQNSAKNVKKTDDKIKVSTTRLDNLVNMVGELVIAQLMVSEHVNSDNTGENELGRKVSHQTKIIRELQELSLSMRMVPIASVFQRMARVARDTSQKENKQVNFVTCGEETELDRNIVDKIADPLIHMVRNSIDHGIESTEDRKKTGKAPVGNVALRAYHQAGNIVIEIEDDGKGLDKNKILQKAIDNGLIDKEQQLSDEEIFKLIFQPGLSTAQKVTAVSGRGVGMDVVRKNIEALRGKIDISSTLGKGTIFTIRLPLTLAIIDGQVIRVGNKRYIAPINSIVHSFRPHPSQISTVQKRAEVVKVGDELIPMVRLYKLFGIEPSYTEPENALVMIVEEDTNKCCLMIDDLLAQQQVVIKSLGQSMGKVKGVSGGAIMGDGKVSLILDIPGLIELAQGQ
jgi:two-component system chemotaxis sensor kinase CheA